MGRGSRKNKNLAPANKNGSPANNGTIYASRRHLYRAFPNSGRGQCGLLALIQEVMEAEGVSPSEILRRTNGELGAELEARVRRLRKSIVAAAHERKGIELDEDPAADGGRTVKECLKDGDIKSYKMFCDVMGREDGWLDPLAMVLGANAIGLEGMQLVETKKEDKAKKTEGGKANEPERLYYASSTTPVEECPCMILIHDGHFEALYQVPDDLREEEERLASEAAARSAETLRQAEEKRLASEAAAARSAEILRRAEEERLASEAAARSAAFAHAVAVPSMRAAPSASPAPTAVPVETAAQAPSPAPTAVPVETAAPSASPAHTAVPVVTAAPAASPAPAVPVVTATTDLPVPETWDLSAATPTASAAPTAVPVVAAPADLPAVGTRMVDAVVKGGDETQGESDDSTAFEILAPDPSRICRVVRGRRYRPVRTASQCAKKVRPFDGVKYTVEIKDTHPSTSDATTSIAVAVDVTIPGGSTSSERHSGYLKGAVGATRSPHLCLFGGGLGRRLSPLGSIRGGACPEEEQGATAAEHETASNCSVHAGAQVTEKSYFLMDQSAEEPGQPGDHDNPGDAKERGEPVELGEPVDAGESGQPGGHGNATGPEEQEETVEPAGEVEQPGGHGNDADPEEQGEPDDPKANLDRLFLELVDLAERDQIPGVQDTFFRTVEQLVGEGVLVSEAFRGTAASQRNAFPRAKKKTYVVVTGREQSGKMLETFVALLKGWMQANHAPVLVLMNSRKDLVRFKDGICAFNKYVSRIWKLAGGEDKDAPAFNMFQDGHTNAYKEALVRATKGRSDIPIMVLIDNPNRTGPFRDDIVPAVREVCGTTDGSVNMCLAIDEADLGYRGGLSAGEKIFLGLEGGGGSLYQLASSCILITATPAAIHLSRNRFKDKERRVDEITPSTNYWGFKTGQEKPGQVNFKAIARQIGGLQDMVNTMASASGRRCALAVQSVESNNDDLDKRAMLSAIKNRGVKGFLAVSWTAKYAKLYTSDADAIKAFDDARPKWFSKKKIGAAEVMELVKEEEAMRREKEEEGKAGKHHEKGKKRAREGKKGENTRKRKRGKGKESGENMPDEEQPGGDGGKFEPIYQYTPVSAKNRDYRSIVTFLHNETELEPKILITAKNAAARGESIKGRDHECPLDYMHVAMRKSNYEYMKQAVARVASNDNRPPGFGPILFASAEMHAIHSNGIIAQENLIERLKSGDIELESLRDLEQKVTTAPEGATVFSKVALEDIDARRMTRLAAAQEVARLVDDILSTTRLKDITIVSQPAAEEMGEVVGEQMAGGGGGEEEQRGDHPTATVVPAGGGLAEETGAEGGESGNANEEEEDEKMAGDADISVPEFVMNNRNELVRIFREEVNEKMLDVPSMAEAMLNSDHFKGFERLKARNIVRHIQSHEGGVRGLLREARVVFDPEDSVFVLF